VEFQFDIASLQNADSSSTNAQCEICYDERIENPIVLKDCNHAFCATCYTEWVKCQKSRTLFMEIGSGRCPWCPKPNGSQDPLELATLFACAGQFVLKEYEPMLYPSEAAPPPLFPIPLDARRQRLYEYAIGHINFVLTDYPHHRDALCAQGHILRYIHPVEAISALKKSLDGSKDPRLGTKFLIYVYLGDAYESLGRYEDACKYYEIILDDTMTMHASNHIYENRVKLLILLKESARCFFRIRRYDFAEYLGKELLHMNREWPGGHVVCAQAQWALGQKEEAVKTMKQSLLYEIPCDEENRQRNMAFLKRMLDASNVDADAATSTVSELD
jgi:Ring finger domain/Tetratricopeptide repeat